MFPFCTFLWKSYRENKMDTQFKTYSNIRCIESLIFDFPLCSFNSVCKYLLAKQNKYKIRKLRYTISKLLATFIGLSAAFHINKSKIGLPSDPPILYLKSQRAKMQIKFYLWLYRLIAATTSLNSFTFCSFLQCSLPLQCLIASTFYQLCTNYHFPFCLNSIPKYFAIGLSWQIFLQNGVDQNLLSKKKKS